MSQGNGMHPTNKRSTTAAVLTALTLWAGSACAAPNPLEFLFTSGHIPGGERSVSHPRILKMGEFSAMRLVPSEAGSVPNQHPAKLSADQLQAVLSKIELLPKDDKPEPLFSKGELEEVAPALAHLLEEAKPDEDVVMLSTARRRNGGLDVAISLSARLFVQGGALQLMVQDARADLYSQYQLTKMVPRFSFGTRASDSGVVLRSPLGVSHRGDWLALSLQTRPAASEPVLALPATPAATPVAPTPQAPALFADQERRLKNLKQLHEQGLIKDEEYEQKRRDIIREL